MANKLVELNVGHMTKQIWKKKNLNQDDRNLKHQNCSYHSPILFCGERE